MKTSTGFSLVEMAMVLLIVSLLIGGLLTPLSGQMTQQQIKQTNTTLQEIKDALVGFAVINQRLPCPDYNGDGIEDTPCSAGGEGTLPWITLSSEQTDVWGRPFHYRVIPGYTTTINSFSINGNLAIKNLQGTALTTTADTGVAAIIFSYGKDGAASNKHDSANLIYVEDSYVENSFDDILVRISSNTLFNRLVASGRYW